MATWKKILLSLATVTGICVALLATGFRVDTGKTLVSELVFYTKIETAAIVYLGYILTYYVSKME